MSLNVSFDGFSYDSDNTLGNSDIYYQGLFYQNSTASSPTTWSDVRVIEGSGYYSLNLGDSLWLSQEGSALNGSIVVLVFWRGSSDRLSNCTLLSEWGATEITLDGSSVYTNSIQIKDNILPTLVWSTNVPAHAYVNTEYTFYNNSYDIHSWNFNTVTMYHWFTRYDEDIFSVNAIKSTSYDWGDSTSTLNLSGASGSAHSWDSYGTYTITITVTDACGAEVTDTTDISVYWNAPVPNIVRCDAVGNILSNTISDPDTPIYFKYVGTDPDATIVSISWTIADSGSYGDTNTTYTSYDDSEVITHTEGLGTSWYTHAATPGAFTNPGVHVVSVSIVWNDGQDDHIINYNETFTQNRFTGPSVDFIQSPTDAATGEVVTFENTSTAVSRVGLGFPDHVEYTWTWNDGETSVVTSDVAYDYMLSKTPSSVECSVELCASWSDGWDTKTTCTFKDVVFGTVVTITPEDCYYVLNVIGTSTDGTATAYGWTIASGTSDSGIFSEVWVSPVADDQQTKTICFSAIGWYKIEGTVYGGGSPTSDYEILYVDEECPGYGVVATVAVCEPEVTAEIVEDGEEELIPDPEPIIARPFTPDMGAEQVEGPKPSPSTVPIMAPFPRPKNI